MNRINDKVQVGAPSAQAGQVDLDALRSQLLAPVRDGELESAKQVLVKLVTTQTGAAARTLAGRLSRSAERGATQLDSEAKAQLRALGELAGQLAGP